jgi:hypothetical protein
VRRELKPGFVACADCASHLRHPGLELLKKDLGELSGKHAIAPDRNEQSFFVQYFVTLRDSVSLTHSGTSSISRITRSMQLGQTL